MAYSTKEISKAKELIIDGLANGYSLTSIIKKNKKVIPTRPIVYQWLNSKHKEYDVEFLNNYTCAREDSADLDAEKIQEIAEKTLTGEHDPASARVAIDAYKWSAGKKKPKKYGDKLDLTSDGEKIDTTPHLTIVHNDKPIDLST